MMAGLLSLLWGLPFSKVLLAQEQTSETPQQQPQKEKSFIIIKLHNPRQTSLDFVSYQTYNMTTNMKNLHQNNTVKYDLEDIRVAMDDTTISFNLFFKIEDTSTPNIVKTRNGVMGLSMPTEDYEKQLNTQSNIISYTGKSTLYINKEELFDVNLKAVLFPNSTGILEIAQV